MVFTPYEDVQNIPSLLINNLNKNESRARSIALPQTVELILVEYLSVLKWIDQPFQDSLPLRKVAK